LPPVPQSTAESIGEPTVLYSREQILAYATGKPSQAFGEPYRPFDEDRLIARLPGPPLCFIDRVIHTEPEPWVLKAGGWITAQYDVPADEWYFSADGSGVMPFCVLLEIALQPCGWLAAYAGSALRSDKNLKFRNLGGRGVIHRNLYPESQTLTMRARMTKVAEAIDMIIEDFEFDVLADDLPIYSGTTYFGFFTAQALAAQVGLREARPMPDANDLQMGQPFKNVPPLSPQDAAGHFFKGPNGLRLPAKALRMIDGIEIYTPNGGPHGLGFIRGYKQLDPDEWFFKAHFYQDPVCPGSLGIESFLQLIKYAALQRWPDFIDSHRFEMVCGHHHQWQYRGQIVQRNTNIVVDAVITHIEGGIEPVIMADGWLQVDGLTIYKMEGFGLKLMKS
jgi:3-hydroxymyristoyl/3-hydroxydecanoyl-(acyl carrier protein) dehydratase